MLNWVLGEGPAYSRSDFWREALPLGVAMLRACDEEAELSAVLSAAWRPTLEGGGRDEPEPPEELHASLRRARDRVNLRLMCTRAESPPSAGERARWIATLRAALPPLPLSLCMLAPAGTDARLEPKASGSGWQLQSGGGDGEAVDAVGVVVPESRALVVVNDEPTGQQLNVRVLDGALGRSAALLPVRERPT